MTVKQLIEHLKRYNPELEVAYSDMNFGGYDSDFEKYNMEATTKYLLIDSVLWEPVD